MVAAAARYAIDVRYRLLDYFYTAFYVQSRTAKPSLNPLFYLYPEDRNTFGINSQFFYGDAILVSPVLIENSTEVEIYLPDDIFYDWNGGFSPVRGNASNITLSDVGFQQIPLHVRGGTIVPLRANSAITTTELRKQPFQLLVAPGLNGTASGNLYLDEGDLLVQPTTSFVNFTYSNGVLSMTGNYDYQDGVDIESISICGWATSPPGGVSVGGSDVATSYNASTQVLTVNATIPLSGDITVKIGETEVYTGSATRSEESARKAIAWTASVAGLFHLLN